MLADDGQFLLSILVLPIFGQSTGELETVKNLQIEGGSTSMLVFEFRLCLFLTPFQQTKLPIFGGSLAILSEFIMSRRTSNTNSLKGFFIRRNGLFELLSLVPFLGVILAEDLIRLFKVFESIGAVY
jgi:hypothetical protein